MNPTELPFKPSVVKEQVKHYSPKEEFRNSQICKAKLNTYHCLSVSRPSKGSSINYVTKRLKKKTLSDS